jgi:lipoate-protein ligase A
LEAGVSVVIDGAPAGAENMRRDAVLLERAIAGAGPLLRIYGWERPTLSLGYFQKLDEVAEAGAAERLGVDVVTRFTGGGAILHHHEITFAIALPASHPWAKQDVNDSYLSITRPLLNLLLAKGVPAKFRGGDDPVAKTPNCFAGAACPDITLQGRKLFGSAQRRREGAVLQHGSLLLDIDSALWKGLFGPRLGSGFISLAEGAPGVTVTFDDLKKAYEDALNGPVQTEKACPA